MCAYVRQSALNAGRTAAGARFKDLRTRSSVRIVHASFTKCAVLQTVVIMPMKSLSMTSISRYRGVPTATTTGAMWIYYNSAKGCRKEKMIMGQAKRELEKQEKEMRHSGQFCSRCGSELTKDEVKNSENLYSQKLCFDCLAEWDKMQKE